MPTAQEIVGEVEAFYRAYIDAFNREDIDNYADFFVPGYSLIHGGKVTAYSTEADLQQYSAQAFIDVKSRGWARSAVDLLTVSPLGDDQAMILAEVTRYRGDESISPACAGQLYRDSRGKGMENRGDDPAHEAKLKPRITRPARPRP